MTMKVLRAVVLAILALGCVYFFGPILYKLNSFERCLNARKQDKRITAVLHGQQGWAELKGEMHRYMAEIAENVEYYENDKIEQKDAERYPLLYKLAPRRILIHKQKNRNHFVLVHIWGSPPDVPNYNILLTAATNGNQVDEYLQRFLQESQVFQKEEGLYVVRGKYAASLGEIILK